MAKKSGINNKRLLGCHYNNRLIGFGIGDEIIYEEVYKIAEGTDIKITDTKNDNGKVIGFECKSIQNGTPSPDIPVPIQSTGDEGFIVVWSGGKNIWDKNGTKIPTRNNFYSKKNVANSIVGNNVINLVDNQARCTGYFKYSINKTITISCNNKYQLLRLNEADKNNIIIQNTDPASSIKTITTSSDRFGIIFRKADNSNFTDIEVEELKNSIMIEEGNIATSYEPYKGNEYPITLPEGYKGSSLNNGVKDTLEMIDGELKLVQRIAKIVLNGSENWRLSQNKTNTISFAINPPTVKANSDLYCDKFKKISNWGVDIESIHIFGNTDTTISIKKERLTTQDLAGFKTWLSQNNTILYCELSTPIYHDANFTTIKTLIKCNNISTTNGIKPLVKIKYLEK